MKSGRSKLRADPGCDVCPALPGSAMFTFCCRCRKGQSQSKEGEQMIRELCPNCGNQLLRSIRGVNLTTGIPIGEVYCSVCGYHAESKPEPVEEAKPFELPDDWTVTNPGKEK